MNKQKSIGKALLTGVAIFALWTTLILGAIGFMTYFNGVIGRYKTYLNDILALTLTEIDADDMEKCINSTTKSESFEKTQDFLNRVKENYDIEHTLSFENVVDDVTVYCRSRGGALA